MDLVSVRATFSLSLDSCKCTVDAVAEMLVQAKVVAPRDFSIARNILRLVHEQWLVVSGTCEMDFCGFKYAQEFFERGPFWGNSSMLHNYFLRARDSNIDWFINMNAVPRKADVARNHQIFYAVLVSIYKALHYMNTGCLPDIVALEATWTTTRPKAHVIEKYQVFEDLAD